MSTPQSKPNKMTWSIVAIVVVLVAVVAGVQAIRHMRSGNGADDAARKQQAIAVRVAPVQKRSFTQRIRLQGTIEAETFADVSPRIPGPIETIFVDEGDTIEAGKTTLFTIDQVKLEKAVQLRRLDVTVAACGLRQAQANVEKVQADFHKARLDLARFERLFEGKAVTADALEQQQSRHAQLEAAIKLARADVDLVAEQHKQAQTALQIAEKDLADATIVAPITGVVTARLQEPGEMGTPGQPILRIEDLSTVKLSAFLPGSYYNDIELGRTKVRLVIAGDPAGDWPISYRSPTIDPRLRTFEIEARIDTPGPGVVPGALAQLDVLLEERQGLGVPSKAIQHRGGQSVVFVAQDGHAKQVPVTLGIENDGWIEMVKADLATGACVITMGQTLVEDGSAVASEQEAQ